MEHLHNIFHHGELLPMHPDVERMRKYILDRDCFNHSKLAWACAWNKTSFSLWLKGDREIPTGTAQYLQLELVRNYGYLAPDS